MSTSTITQAMPPAATASAWVPARLYRMTVEQYEAMAASGAIPSSHRVHLINGYLVEKMTQKPPHVIAASLSREELARVTPAGWHIRSAHPVRLPAQASEPEPNHCVVRGTIVDYAERHPGPDDVALIVEVADTSLADDPRWPPRSTGPRASRSTGSLTSRGDGSRSTPGPGREDTARPQPSPRASQSRS